MTSTATPIGSSPSDDTRERLLDVAEGLFAERGYAAVSVRELTQAASCNVAAVNYHFGGKEALYREVFRRRLRALRDFRIGRVEAAMNGARVKGDLEPVLEAFASAFLEPLLVHSSGRATMQLMMQELLNPHLPKGMLWEEMFDPVRRVLSDAIRELSPEIAEGDALRSVHSVVAQLVHAIHVRNPHDPEVDLAAMEKHIVSFSMAGIESFRRSERESRDAE